MRLSENVVLSTKHCQGSSSAAKNDDSCSSSAVPKAGLLVNSGLAGVGEGETESQLQLPEAIQRAVRYKHDLHSIIWLSLLHRGPGPVTMYWQSILQLCVFRAVHTNQKHHSCRS